jgi:OmpA-OmpF porin, OOP family
MQTQTQLLKTPKKALVMNPVRKVSIMKTSNSLTLVAAAVCAFALSGAANAQTLNPQEKRITDEAIHADYQTYEAQQVRIKGLNDTGNHRVASYSLAKAQCWLDVSFHEYTRNDRSAFPQEALTESFKITQFLSKGGAVAAADNPANKTPMVNGAARLREDLWAQANALKGHAGYRCAEQKVACAEVELVHAGNEHNQQQWRHAKPYVQIAEDYLGEAKAAADQCVPKPAIVAVAPAPVAPPPPPVVPGVVRTPVNLAANVLFNFDKRDLPNIRAMTKERLDKLISDVKSGGFSVQSINLVGHADRSNFTGKSDYNIRLAEDRVMTVRNYMVAQGVPAQLIRTSSRADSQQVEACQGKFRTKDEYHECLLPNRRVEVTVQGVR